MRPAVALTVLAVVVAAVFGIALWPRVQSHFGYATPFGLPDTIHVDGRDYVDPSGCTAPVRRDRPLKRVASVPGFLTGSKPLYFPHPLQGGRVPAYLFVRSGCLRAYDLSGGP